MDQEADRAALMTSQNRHLCTSSRSQQLKTAVFKTVIQIAAMHQSTSKNIKTEKNKLRIPCHISNVPLCNHPLFDLFSVSLSNNCQISGGDES